MDVGKGKERKGREIGGLTKSQRNQNRGKGHYSGFWFGPSIILPVSLFLFFSLFLSSWNITS